MDPLRHYREVWFADFEFRQPSGETPEPICMVAIEYQTGRTHRVWADELADMAAPPFSVAGDSLFVAYFASSELSCFLALGWPRPARVLDLYDEFRWLTNGVSTPCGNGLIGAMTYFGLDAIEAARKDEMRDLALRGGPFSPSERQDLLEYCESDVISLRRLLPKMLPHIDFPRTLLRGRYMAAVATMERFGVPIDVETLDQLKAHWDALKSRLTWAIDQNFGVFVPTGQRPINPESRLGAEIYRLARAYRIDPYILAFCVDEAWALDRELNLEAVEAIQAARKATGLTKRRLNRWEDDGRDHSTYPQLDAQARELAGQYPELGIGGGYNIDEAFDDTDYAARLWDRLKHSEDRLKPKYDSDILDEALVMASEIDTEEWYRDRPLSFNTRRFAQWLSANDIPWPQLQSGALDLSDDTFRMMARLFTQVAPLRELRHSLGEMRLFADLAVGHDGRNRCLLSPFRSITSRNQPSNAKFIFGPSCWLRGVIKPGPGRAIGYIDWEQQEFGIAAALSGDEAMLEAYASGDPYLTFAKQAGAVPQNATKQSHPQHREQFKVCALAVQYGMGSRSLSQTLGEPEPIARDLLRLHRQTYPRFWRWSQAAVDHAMLYGHLHTVFGWRVRVGTRANPRSLANFPMQANGAEMLRLGCSLATESGIQVCAPVHDALLVEGPADSIDEVVTATQELMATASRCVLSGFSLRSDAQVVRWPDRYMDKRGRQMWDTVMALLSELQSGLEMEADDWF